MDEELLQLGNIIPKSYQLLTIAFQPLAVKKTQLQIKLSAAKHTDSGLSRYRYRILKSF